MRCRRRHALLSAAGLLLAGRVAWADTAPGLQLRGRARLRVLGLSIYDATLWTGEPFSPLDFAASTLQLELAYHRPFRGSAIVDRSLQEMARGGPLPTDRLETWRAFLQRAIPDVQGGDRLVARWSPERRSTRLGRPGEGGQELQDADFGPRFLGIWLAPHSSEPQLRVQLLGQA